MAPTENDILERLQIEGDFTESQSIQVTECLLEQTKATLQSGDDTLVSGSGKFDEPVKSRNPDSFVKWPSSRRANLEE